MKTMMIVTVSMITKISFFTSFVTALLVYLVGRKIFKRKMISVKANRTERVQTWRVSVKILLAIRCRCKKRKNSSPKIKFGILKPLTSSTQAFTRQPALAPIQASQRTPFASLLSSSCDTPSSMFSSRRATCNKEEIYSISREKKAKKKNPCFCINSG